MARRDYRAEEARRNERAREAGFSSRAQERRIRNVSQNWSNEHAEKAISTFTPGESSEYTRAYYDAFVSGGSGFHTLQGHRGGPRKSNQALYHFFVEVTDYMTREEFVMKYGEPQG